MKQKAFSLVELLVVIAIVAILAAMSYGPAIQLAKELIDKIRGLT